MLEANIEKLCVAAAKKSGGVYSILALKAAYTAAFFLKLIIEKNWIDLLFNEVSRLKKSLK